jgi:hypothetical protein
VQKAVDGALVLCMSDGAFNLITYKFDNTNADISACINEESTIIDYFQLIFPPYIMTKQILCAYHKHNTVNTCLLSQMTDEYHPRGTVLFFDITMLTV